MFSKFLLGKLTVDDDARRALSRTPLDLIARHAVCDFGAVSPRRFKQNQIALSTGDEIQSEYLIDPTSPDRGRVKIVTALDGAKPTSPWSNPNPRKGNSVALLFSFFRLVRFVARVVKVVSTGIALAHAARRYAR